MCHVCPGFLRGLKALRGLAKLILAPPAMDPEAANQVLASVQAAIRKGRP